MNAASLTTLADRPSLAALIVDVESLLSEAGLRGGPPGDGSSVGGSAAGPLRIGFTPVLADQGAGSWSFSRVPWRPACAVAALPLLALGRLGPWAHAPAATEGDAASAELRPHRLPRPALGELQRWV